MTMRLEPAGRLPSAEWDRVQQAVARFEEAWREGRRPSLADHLEGSGEERQALLVELAHADLELRLKAGEAARVESYLQAWPELASDADATFGLISAEYNLRRRGEPGVTLDEYRRRFPDHGPRLERLSGDPAGAPPPPDTVRDDSSQRGGLAPEAPPPPQVPGFEILGELGRGGMGVVYKARHLALKRTVALKMILTGGYAGAAERARFKAEAEAVARLQHPGIVQVFEVGEHQGHPFCALEFVEGGSLAQRLNGNPLPPKEAARLVEALARAIHLAHSRNVVHRDLKPANVLLTPDGAPKVTDFGLARQLDAETGHTPAGAVMGTPAYMAPEQATGQAHAAGPAADVYALGAILYECLTGRPPFRAATLLETMEQVRTREPAPPRQVQPAAPRDLETICLKCLRKEPEKRYASAAELADELARFQRGEPVLARPVGRLERTARWARRNPVLAVALAAVFVSAVVASGLAAAAWWANRELGHKNVELGAKTSLLQTQNQQLETKNAEVEREKAEKERQEAQAQDARLRTWLTPLAPQPGGLTDQEVAALRMAAVARGQPVAMRYLQKAASDTALTPRLAARAEYVWHAALGLDRSRRDEAERLLLAELRAAEPRSPRRRDLARSAAALGGLSPDAAAEAMEALAQAVEDASDRGDLAGLAPALAAAAARVGPEGSGPAGGRAAAVLADAITRSTDMDAISALAEALADVAARQRPGESAAIVVAAMSRTKRPDALQALARVLAATGLPPGSKEPGEAAGVLGRALEVNQGIFRQQIAGGLEALAPLLGPADAAAAGAALGRAIEKTTNWFELQSLASALAAVAARLPPDDAAAACGQAADTIIKNMGDLRNVPVEDLGHGLAALNPRLASPQAARAAAMLREAITRTAQPGAHPRLAIALAATAERLDGKDVGEVASAISAAMSRTTDAGQAGALAWGLAAVAARMPPTEAAAACRPAAAQVAKALARPNGPITPWLAQTLLNLCDRLPQDEAAALCDEAAVALARALAEQKTPYQMQFVAAGLAVVADRAGPQAASEAAGVLGQAVRTATNPAASQMQAQGLAAAASRLGPKEAAVACTPAAQTLLQAMGRADGAATLTPLALGLAALAPELEPGEAARVCSAAASQLSRAVAKATNPAEAPALAQGLSVVAVRLRQKEMEDACAPAADALAQAMTRTSNPQALLAFAQALWLLEPRLGPGRADNAYRRAAAALAEATGDDRMLPQFGYGVAAVTCRLEPGDASTACGRVAAALTYAMAKDATPAQAIANGSFGDLFSMVQKEHGKSLSSVLARQPPGSSTRRLACAAGLAAELGGPTPCLTAPVLAQFAYEPLPATLPVQTLVDLLKDPLCVGEARRLVLEQCEQRYGRPFADQWDFVRYAEQQNLGLDFVGPSRPVPAAP
jgi:hypothetical protein